MDMVMYIARLVLRIMWKAGLLALVVLWRLPWLVFAWTPALLTAFRRAWSYPARLRAATQDWVHCPRCGRAQSLLARWVCPVCRGIEATHAFAPCRVCGTQVPAGYIRCEDPDCRTAIVNPLLGGGQ